MNGPRTRRAAGAACAAALVVAAAACGGSSAKPAGAPSVATPGTTSSSGRQTPNPTRTVAPDALVAAKVVASAELASLRPVGRAQDDGGLTVAGEGFTSQATLTTKNSTLTIALTTSPTAAAAASAYSLYEPPSGSAPPTTLAGLGDKAIVVSGAVVVLKGAQVLRITPRLSAAGEKALDDAKSNNTLTQALVDAANAVPVRDAERAARAIVAKLTGATASGDLTYLPAGALDPCGFDPSTLNAGDIKVTSAPALSDLAPASECVYTFTGSKLGEPGTGQLALYSLTTPQGAAAQPATTPARAYANVLVSFAAQSRSSGSSTTGSSATGTSGTGASAPPFGSDTAGPFSTAAMTSGEPDFAMLVGPTAADANATRSGLMLRIWDYRSTYVVDRRHCHDEIAKMFNEMLDEAAANGHSLESQIGTNNADTARTQWSQDIRDWCIAQEQSYAQHSSGVGG